jgi:acyl-CoA thioester hydrolase
MSRAPIVYESKHRIRFSDLDPYKHVSTGNYATYFVDHRMQCLREYAGWDLDTLESAPFMIWARRLEIDFIRPVQPDQEIVITSFVREYRGPDALVDCEMLDKAGKKMARCHMVVAYVDKGTERASDWPEDIQALFFHDSERASA